jgi:hypothetical protein
VGTLAIQKMICPRCRGLVLDQVGDRLDRSLSCVACGWRMELTQTGQPYQSPSRQRGADEIEDGAISSELSRLPHLNEDGCRHHPVCVTCPFRECIATFSQPYGSRDDWFEGKTVEDLTTDDVYAEVDRTGITKRQAFRRLKLLKSGGRHHAPRT